MPRAKNGANGPSASSRFTAARGGRADGKQIVLADVTDESQLWELVQDAVASGVAVTIGRTRDGSSISVSFFADGERSAWYLSGREDWTDLVATTSV